MSDYTIGIKLGDGSFYSILEKNFTGKKRFVLSTVKDNQESMQIDFYQSKLASIEDAEYIGSLVIENIESQPKGEPEIEVILGLNPDNTLFAIASNLNSEERQSLQVSLNNLSTDSTYDVPDFEIESDIQSTKLFDDDSPEILPDSTAPTDSFTEVLPEKPKGNPLLMVLFIIGGLIIVGAITVLIWWLVVKFFPNQKTENNNQTEMSAAPAQTNQEKSSEAPTTEPTQKPASATTNEPGQTERSTGQQNNMGGYNYSVKRGDTLWDLAQSAYSDPFKWKLIYQANQLKIKDPNIILIGQEIDIPKN